jgi:hypothetical protein
MISGFAKIARVQEFLLLQQTIITSSMVQLGVVSPDHPLGYETNGLGDLSSCAQKMRQPMRPKVSAMSLLLQVTVLPHRVHHVMNSSYNCIWIF